MFGIHSSKGYTEILTGIQIKTLCYGQLTLTTEFRLLKDAILPEHVHPNEQTGYLISGMIRLYIDGVARELTPSDSWSIPGNVSHRAEILEDSVAIEVFSPVREDYLNYAFAVDRDDSKIHNTTIN